MCGSNCSGCGSTRCGSDGDSFRVEGSYRDRVRIASYMNNADDMRDAVIDGAPKSANFKPWWLTLTLPFFF